MAPPSYMNKTELCSYHFQEFTGAKTKCQRGDRCTYAHTLRELRLTTMHRRGVHAAIIRGNIEPTEDQKWVLEAAASLKRWGDDLAKPSKRGYGEARHAKEGKGGSRKHHGSNKIAKKYRSRMPRAGKGDVALPGAKDKGEQKGNDEGEEQVKPRRRKLLSRVPFPAELPAKSASGSASHEKGAAKGPQSKKIPKRQRVAAGEGATAGLGPPPVPPTRARSPRGSPSATRRQ